jgi:serine/threonine protein kinase
MQEPDSYNLTPGRKLGKNYKVVEFLGKGWEGEVYKVAEEDTGVVRAAKLFYDDNHFNKKPHITYAKRLFKLRHCPIVMQYHHKDTVKIAGKKVDVLVSEFVEGERLSQFISRQKQQRLQPFEALHLFNHILYGIEEIHYLYDYHGDIHSDNIMVKRKGLGFEVHLIDLLHLGKPSKNKIQTDVYDLINLLHEILGGTKYYQKLPKAIKNIILGRKKSLIKQHYNNAGHLRVYLENVNWQDS